MPLARRDALPWKNPRLQSHGASDQQQELVSGTDHLLLDGDNVFIKKGD